MGSSQAIYTPPDLTLQASLRQPLSAFIRSRLMSQPLLFTPLDIAGVTLKNRVVIAPMATYSATNGFASDWHIAHLGRMALGGASAVMVEATAVTQDGRITNGDMGLWSNEHIAPLKRTADVIRQCGAVPAIQLAHAGRKGSMQRPWHGNGPLTPQDIARGDKQWQPVAPTAEPIDNTWPAPRALSIADLGELKQHWAEATKRAHDAGFDILEIHNAHGYLIHQFLSPLSNTRNDGYGGDFAGRTRFPLEVAEAVRSEWPSEKPLFVRVSAVDGLDHGWSIEDTVSYAKALKERGIDVIDCSSGGLRGSATAARVKRTYGFQVPYAERVRKEAGIASMAVGLIIDPDLAEAILRNGQADLIAIAREALVNPNWPLEAKVALGQPVMENFDDHALQYGWWLKHRERTLEDIRADESGPA